MSNQFVPNSETCFVPLSGNGLNPTFFPVGTAQHLDLNYNILPFLCDLLKATVDDSVSPVLTDVPPPFDISPFTDFSYLSAVGDPRVSLGETMTETYVYFLPRVIAQTEVRQAGGTQIIDNYICTADGTPIKKAEAVSSLISLDLTGQKPYQYGAITIPPLSSTYQELMRIIEPQEVTTFVQDFFTKKIRGHAEELVSFTKTYLGDWKVDSIDAFNLTKFITINLKKGNQTAYLKYYLDVVDKIACLFKIDEINYYDSYLTPDSLGQAMGFGSQIPNYVELMKNPRLARQFRDLVLDNYVTTPDKQFSKMFEEIEEQGEDARRIQRQYQRYFNSISGGQSTRPRKVRPKPC